MLLRVCNSSGQKRWQKYKFVDITGKKSFLLDFFIDLQGKQLCKNMILFQNMLLFLFFPDSALSDDENSIMGPIRLFFCPAHVRHLFAVGKRDEIAIISLFFSKIKSGIFWPSCAGKWASPPPSDNFRVVPFFAPVFPFSCWVTQLRRERPWRKNRPGRLVGLGGGTKEGGGGAI